MNRLFSLRRNGSTLRFRLMLTVGLILFVCQVISVIWLWHESKEQIQLLVDASLKNLNNHKHIEKEIHEAVASLAVPSLVMISLALVLCFQAVKWITKPLYELQNQLENRTGDDLESINCHSSVREIDAVTMAINQLVSRLTSSLERERLFTADVAHELRTPLAGLRLHLELIERNNGINVQPLLQRLDQMTNSVSQLLQLARVGHSFTAGNYQNVSLIQDVILPIEFELKTLLSQRQQRLKLELSEDVIIRGDATLMKLLLRNLVENAHRYSPENSTIGVRLDNAASPVLAVEDEGPGIDESKSGELTRAFVRMDRRYGGIGLGLSIVTRIAQLHKSQFFLENRRPETGCRAWVRFNISE
ncbi:two-component system sensor histidine kinase PmrB [Enterobacteriaceae bacterium H20N1]|uniref:histidine kinase n=1 Tax=Dryocola boscaweniae TaxID=2925397 RepID=A0A9X3APR7_9ENTR|nr:two-component system sensor histidine kinase PmrB [Dryocola boscaweniae]MCT4703836.1 two-component system sensor histidine kinase PmrB [Dryocola boscaweniae]MCT4721004.1 two-component system sensor histidine kinase PmrB [Dryocola boscaweniae]